MKMLKAEDAENISKSDWKNGKYITHTKKKQRIQNEWDGQLCHNSEVPTYGGQTKLATEDLNTWENNLTVDSFKCEIHTYNRELI